MARIIHKDFGLIEVNGSTDFSLRIYRADNELCVFLEGSEVFRKKTSGDPDLKGRKVALKLNSGENNLAVIGWNGSAKGHYKWELHYGAGKLEGFSANDSPTTRNGIAAVYTIRFIVQNLRTARARKKRARSK
jgi:hypothetical protein